MSQQNHEQEIFARMPQRLPRPVGRVFGLLVVVGVITFIIGATGDHAQRAWQTFLINFLVWSGIAQAGIVFAAILQVSNGRWGGSVRRIAESTAAFMPVSFVLFLVLFFGFGALFPWIHQPIPEKAVWLNAKSLFVRDGLALLLLYSLSLLFLYYSVRPDLGLAAEQGFGKREGFSRKVIAHWRGLEAERQRSQRILSVLSPIILILYAYIFSLLAFDLVMSLAPHWYSNLFGGFFFMGNLYLGLAAIIIMAVLVRKHLRLEAYITAAQLHDLGKLLFGFAVFWAYLTFTQYLVIWYGNMPEETEFLFVRTKEAPWSTLSWSIFTICFVIPFIILLSREVKRRPGGLLAISVLCFVGMWLERFILVVPSIWHSPEVPLGITEILISLGFLAAFVLTSLRFMQMFPAISLADPTVLEGTHEHAEATA
jgi:Ni/Fe-hydrogenase subunit HybB-like protein